MKLACQENLLPGATLAEKWAVAQTYGFDGIEIQAGSLSEWSARRESLLSAARSGVVMPTICLAGGPFIGEFDPAKRKEAIERMKFLLSFASQIGASGVITPAAWGIFSKRLPPHIPPRSDSEDHAVLLEGLSELGKVAMQAGSTLLFEPLNRYEDHMVNTLQQAISIIKEVGMDSVKVLGDLYHMNIEEADIPKSIEHAKGYLAHIHLCDSNRHEAGAGHIAFRPAFEALAAIDFRGWGSFECRLSGEASVVLPRSVEFLRAISD